MHAASPPLEGSQQCNAVTSEASNFYGVYLLFCTTPQYLGDVYIGFTVNPGRRIKQHNKGVASGGAYTTSKKGSWEMTLVVHGFPNDKSALRFEWSWQHPKKSRRLSHVPARRYKKESKFEYALRVLSVMFSVAPWKRLSLTLQWLDMKYIKDLPLAPPSHISIIREEVDLPKYLRSHPPPPSAGPCGICTKPLAGSVCCRCVLCPSPPVHLRCFAQQNICAAGEPQMLIPVMAICQDCKAEKPWNNWIRENLCQVVEITEEV